MKVFINPGHCPGLDPGAINYAMAVNEAEIVREIGDLVAIKLEEMGIDSVVLQDNELDTICDEANGCGADYFVSIHCNAFNGRAQGTETFCYARGGSGECLASSIQRQIVKCLDTVDRGVKTAGYYVLKYTAMPAVLVECAFIDNPEDCLLLIDNTEVFATAIAQGIMDYIMEIANG